MMKKIILPIVVILLLAALIYIGIRGNSPAADNDTVAPLTDTSSEAPSAPEWQSPDGPMQSVPLESDEIPAGAIKISMSSSGITPASFEVAKGAEITLSITSIDEWTHIFKFKDESLSEVAVGLGPGITRAIIFNAPNKEGDYEFYCDVPGHEARGETGAMTVK